MLFLPYSVWCYMIFIEPPHRVCVVCLLAQTLHREALFVQNYNFCRISANVIVGKLPAFEFYLLILHVGGLLYAPCRARLRMTLADTRCSGVAALGICPAAFNETF